jgi:hypothetical protein
MKLKGERMDLKTIFKTLGLPFALIAVIVALLAWAGLDIGQIEIVAASLIGLQLAISFLIDVLKYAGVVDDGAAGKWSAGFNLAALVGVAVWMKFYPAFDIHSLDAQIGELAKLLGLIFAYITQMIGTKAVHRFSVEKLGITVFSNKMTDNQ